MKLTIIAIQKLYDNLKAENEALKESRDDLLGFAKQHKVWSQWFDDDYNKLIQKAEALKRRIP